MIAAIAPAARKAAAAARLRLSVRSTGPMSSSSGAAMMHRIVFQQTGYFRMEALGEVLAAIHCKADDLAIRHATVLCQVRDRWNGGICVYRVRGRQHHPTADAVAQFRHDCRVGMYDQAACVVEHIAMRLFRDRADIDNLPQAHKHHIGADHDSILPDGGRSERQREVVGRG